MSRSRSFNKQKTSDKEFLLTQLKKHFEMVFEDMIEKNLETKTITLLLRNKEFEVFHYPYHFSYFTCDRNELYQKACHLLDTFYCPDMIYRSVGIIF